MGRKKIKNPSIIAFDGFFYKNTRKVKLLIQPHWAWPENPDLWYLEPIIAGEPGDELPNELLNVMKAVIDGLYNDVVYTDFNKSRLMRIAYLWNPGLIPTSIGWQKRRGVNGQNPCSKK